MGDYIAISFFGFNPRARDGRDKSYHPHTLAELVSIHAPVMGATLNRRQCL
tara:strand:+ start:4513 stop:4665 length:153 start_codon:yes stop_codon:yes gene_type:complete